MASSRSPRRNPYRSGTASYARVREAILKRRTTLAQANAARAKTPGKRRLAKRRVSSAQRALRAIERREEYRSKLKGPERTSFDRLPITTQDRLLTVRRDYPERVPKDLPDPFVGPKRSNIWRLYYSTRNGIRPRPMA